MYDELIELLRDDNLCLSTRVIHEAADVIEELSHDYETLAEDFNGAVELLHKRSKPHWIPVTERLPNENDDVLIYGEWTGASGTKYREIWLTDLKGFLHQGYKPIAWMPLPSAPTDE